MAPGQRCGDDDQQRGQDPVEGRLSGQCPACCPEYTVPWPALAGLALARSVRLGACLTAALNQYRPDASGTQAMLYGR